MLTLVAACVGLPVLGRAQGIDASVRYVLGFTLRASAKGDTFAATVWAADRPGFLPVPQQRANLRGYYLRLSNREFRDQFVSMIGAVTSGRARMTIKLDDRGKTIESMQLDLTV